MLILAFLLLIAPASAQIQYYGIDAVLDDFGRSSVKMTVTFVKPETIFTFNTAGKIENFNATSLTGPVDCRLVVSGMSTITCMMSLTTERRTINMNFETNDFVRILDNKFYFDVDFSLNQNINQVFASIKLPEGMALVQDKIPGKLSYPENATPITDGRRIIVTWKLDNLQKTQPIRLQIWYEQLENPIFRFWQYILIGIVAAGIVAFLIIRYTRKPEELILSVLDEYEKKIMDTIVVAGGVTNQKKVVQDTNLSKAKVSRVVKSLVERGLIETERIGRNNKLRLIKKKFKL
jgi:predicted transcriptional regulator